MDLMEGMLQRRSCRSYLPRQVEDEALEQILLAGSYAANGRGKQSVRVVVVQDPTIREQLRAMNAAILGAPDTDPFYGAPTVAVVLADPQVSTWVEDGSLVLGNMMLAATALGLGSCWIHRARQEFDSPEGKALLAAWSLPQELRGVGHCILGYPAGAASTPAPRRADFSRKV